MEIIKFQSVGSIEFSHTLGQEQSTDYATSIMHFYITYKKYVFLNIGI